jgi:hypothetical protein
VAIVLTGLNYILAPLKNAIEPRRFAGLKWIGIYTRFDLESTTVDSPTKFNGHTSWPIVLSDQVSTVNPEYDARNIDPSITALQETYAPGWPGPGEQEPIVPGERTYGFSFRVNAYDPNPKVFFYEVEGHWASSDPERKVWAWGWTGKPCGPSSPPVGGELVVSSEPQSLLLKYGLLLSTILITPAAAIFYLEKKKRRT